MDLMQSGFYITQDLETWQKVQLLGQNAEFFTVQLKVCDAGAGVEARSVCAEYPVT
jgi:hypothetical protein